jgi:DNA-binding response OmpR family regulator
MMQTGEAMKILLVEDEAKLARFLKKGLEEEGYAVDHAADGEAAEVLWDSPAHDLVILDLRLPKKDGLTLLKERRRAGNRTPVLILSAKGSVGEKIEGLDSGSDDYLAKPFDLGELLARVRSLVRRGAASGTAEITVADLSIDPVSRKVMRAGRRITLTPKEYSLLVFLARNAGRTMSRAMIIDHVWDTQSDAISNVIDVCVNHLREKIDGGAEVKLIRTVRGVGYVVSDREE